MLENPSRNMQWDKGWRLAGWTIGSSREVIKNRLQETATVRRFLDGTNVANQRPPFWSGLKSTNPAISSQLKSCFLLAQSTLSAKI